MPPLQMLSSESINLDGRREIKAAADLETSRVQLEASAASVQGTFTTRPSTCKKSGIKVVGRK